MTTPIPPVSTPAQLAAEQASRFQESANKIRERADASAKTVSALGAVALGAAGLTKITDLLPLPEDGATATIGVALTILGFVAMGVAVLWFAIEAARINRPVYIVSDLEDLDNDINADEKLEVKRVFEKTVSLNRGHYKELGEADGLEKYEAIGVKLQEEASRLDEATSAKKLQEAAAIDADVREAQARAAALVIRKRASALWRGGFLWRLGALLVAGIVAFGAGTDLLATGRSDSLTASLKSCGEAQKALVDSQLTATLPDACGVVENSGGTGSAAPAVVRERTTTLVALTAQYQSCLARTKDPTSPECVPTLMLIRELVGQ